MDDEILKRYRETFDGLLKNIGMLVKTLFFFSRKFIKLYKRIARGKINSSPS